MYATEQRMKANPERFGSKANVARIKLEQRIARAVLRRILAAGYTVMIDDGEELSPEFTSERAAWDYMGETDEDRLIIYSPADQGRRVGSILLIWGNGEDIVSDYSWNQAWRGSEDIVARLAGG